MAVELEYDGDEPRRMRCTACGERGLFDENLPYVKQTASFTTGHDCALVPPDTVD